MLNLWYWYSQPAPQGPAPTYPAAPQQPAYQATQAPSSTYGVPRGARLTSQNFQRQNFGQQNRAPKTSFRNNQGSFGNFRQGRFQG